MERGKVVRREGTVVPDGNKMKGLEERSAYKYLGILGEVGEKHEQKKDQIRMSEESERY